MQTLRARARSTTAYAAASSARLRRSSNLLVRLRAEFRCSMTPGTPFRDGMVRAEGPHLPKVLTARLGNSPTGFPRFNPSQSSIAERRLHAEDMSRRNYYVDESIREYGILLLPRSGWPSLAAHSRQYCPLHALLVATGLSHPRTCRPGASVVARRYDRSILSWLPLPG